MATILVVDARPANRSFLTTLLGDRGHRVVEACDGFEALATAEAERPQLVISDVVMPTMDGYEFVHRLRERPDLAATPVLFFTARFAEGEARAFAQACGVSQVLTKPSDPETLLCAVDAALGEQQADPSPLGAEAFEQEHQRMVSGQLLRSTMDLREANRRLAHVVEAARGMASARDPATLVAGCCRAARRMLHAEIAAVGMTSPDARGLRHFAADGLGDDAAEILRRVAVQSALLEQTITRRRPLQLAELPDDPLKLVVHATPGASPPVLAVPVLPAAGAPGWICLLGAPGAPGFRQTDADLATMLAAQLGVAYEGALLLASERQARHAAEAANRARDEFLSIVSHELRSPLTAILGWATALDPNDHDPEAFAAGLDAIARNARLQARLVGDILDASQLASGTFHLQRRSVDCATLLRGVAEAMQPEATAKQIELTLSIEAAAPVIGDAARLEQVLTNVLANALKFTPGGGRVTAVLRRRGDVCEIVVRDTGQGIRADVLPRVFERFVQEDSSTTRQHGGLGLGLAIVRGLVELHDGCVRAHSAGPGRGTTITITLPVLADATTARQPTAPAVAPGPRLDGLRILVLDDEPDICEVLSLALSAYGAEVATHATTASAFADLLREPPDVLVLDLGLPGEDGYALMRRIRALPPAEGGGRPAIALTGFARGEDRDRALEAGFQQHVAKPVEVRRLATMIAALAGREPGADEP